MNSFDSKKSDRLQEAKVAYNNLKKYYPESKYLKKADDMLRTINKELENFSK
jgi:outer membrane protein assembly factor BamD